MRLADRVQEPREGALEADAERPVVGRLVAVHRGAEGAAEGVAPAPALQARGAVARAHRLAVVEAQALAQPDRPGPAVAAGVVAFRHLRLRAHGAVHAVERVEDVVAVLHGDQRGREDRVERDEVGRGHEAQCARPRVLADRGQRQGGCCRYLQEVAALAGHRAASSGCIDPPLRDGQASRGAILPAAADRPRRYCAWKGPNAKTTSGPSLAPGRSASPSAAPPTRDRF